MAIIVVTGSLVGLVLFLIWQPNEEPTGITSNFETKYLPKAIVELKEPIKLLGIRSTQVAGVVYGVNDKQQVDQAGLLTMYHAVNGTNDILAVTLQNGSNRSIIIDSLLIIGKKYDSTISEFQDVLISIPITNKTRNDGNAVEGVSEPVLLGRGRIVTAYIQGSWPDVEGFYAEAQYSYRDGSNYTIKMSQPWWKNEDLGLKLLQNNKYNTVSENSDYNLMIKINYANNRNTEGFEITVKNIGEHNLKLYGVHVGGIRCFDDECDGEFPVIDYRMVGTDSSSPMYPAFEYQHELKPNESITSTVTGSWPLAQKFRAVADYSLISGKSWLDEHRFSVATTWNRSNIAVERDFNGASTAVNYYHIYQGMPEPMVYVYKSLSADRIEDATTAANRTARIVDPRIVIKALEYDPNAQIRISDVATGISASEFAGPKAGYIFALVPTKLSQDQLTQFEESFVEYGFKLIGRYTGYSIATDQDENMRVQIKYQAIKGRDNVTLSITNIGSKTVLIQDANVGVQNILAYIQRDGINETYSSSFKGIYNLIAFKNSVPEPVYLAPLRLDPGHTISGSFEGNWPDWQMFVSNVAYEPKDQVIVAHRVSSEISK